MDGADELGDDGEDEDDMAEAMVDGDDRAAEDDGEDSFSAVDE